MKICPNCGAQVEKDYKFCTKCGHKFDPAQQPVGSRTNAAQPTRSQMYNSTQSQPQSAQQPQMQTQIPVQPQQQTQNQFTSQISNAVQNFDANNLWQWFVNSWKHPVGEQNAEKWYGIVTFIVEDLLFVFASAIVANQAMSSATFGLFSGNSETNGIFVQLFLFFVLLTFGSILASFVGSKFVYGQSTPSWWDYTNRVAQIDNLSAIFIVIAFVGGLMKSAGLYSLLSLLAGIFFILAVFAPILINKNAKRDKFYGLIIAIVLQLIILSVLISIFGQNIIEQLKASFMHMF